MAEIAGYKVTATKSTGDFVYVFYDAAGNTVGTSTGKTPQEAQAKIEVTPTETATSDTTQQTETQESTPQTTDQGNLTTVQTVQRNTGDVYELKSDGNWYLANGQKADTSNTSSSYLNTLNSLKTEIASAPAGGTSTTGSIAGGGDGSAPSVPDASLPTDLLDELTASAEFQGLPEDQQELVKQVYQVIAENDIDNAQRLAAAFETATKISDPFFKQQIRIAKDAIERGFVSIDQEEEFREQQLTNQLKDLREDVATKKEFLGLEEQAALRGLEREFESTLKTTRQNLAASGFSSSSRRAETEEILNETTGDLRESTKRRFGAQVSDLATSLGRGERDIQSEVQRLTELTKSKKLDLFRQAEETLGTKNLPSLNTTADPLGSIVGEIPQAQTRDIISGATSLIF